MDTKISSGFSQNFSGKYQIDANQEMKTSEACLARDKAVGMMLALNDNDVNKASVEKLNGFLKNEYKAKRFFLVISKSSSVSPANPAMTSLPKNGFSNVSFIFSISFK